MLNTMVNNGMVNNGTVNNGTVNNGTVNNETVNDKSRKKEVNMNRMKFMVTFYKIIMKNAHKYQIVYNINEFLKADLKRTLIICNHDYVPVDFLSIPFFLGDHLGLPLSIVAGSDTDIFEMVKQIFVNQKLIGTGGATDKIIEDINDGRTVLLFIGWKRADRFFQSSAVKRIIDQTGCRPMFMSIDLAGNHKNSYKSHPILTEILKSTLLNIRYNNAEKDELIEESRAFMGVIEKYFRIFLGDTATIMYRFSPNFATTEELKENKDFLKQINLRHRSEQDIYYYDKVVRIPKERTDYYIKLVDRAIHELKKSGKKLEKYDDQNRDFHVKKVHEKHSSIKKSSTIDTST